VTDSGYETDTLSQPRVVIGADVSPQCMDVFSTPDSTPESTPHTLHVFPTPDSPASTIREVIDLCTPEESTPEVLDEVVQSQLVFIDVNSPQSDEQQHSPLFLEVSMIFKKIAHILVFVLYINKGGFLHMRIRVSSITCSFRCLPTATTASLWTTTTRRHLRW
jgi:hypothetical protein